MSTHHAIDELGPDTPFDQAAKVMVWTRFEAMWKHREGVEAGDVEALHDMRVGSRRLRAALDMAAPLFTDHQHQAFRQLTEQLTDELGAVRDGDVLLQTIQELGAATGEEGRIAAQALCRVVEARRTVERTQLLGFLRHLETVGYAKNAAHLWQAR